MRFPDNNCAVAKAIISRKVFADIKYDFNLISGVWEC